MKILVTAGPTREHIDPVRFISNRSSGRMGYAIARVCARRGHQVILVSGPVVISAPRGVKVIKVETAADMLEAVEGRVNWCDALVMAAAVADFAPRHISREKIKKRGMRMVMELRKTRDILMTIRPLKEHRIFVGFAAESTNVLSEARRKLWAKGLDLVVANDISKKDSGFDVDTNRVVLIYPGNVIRKLPLLRKIAVAGRILDWIEERHDEVQ